MPARFTLYKLHAAIQLAMDGHHSNLYEFELRKRCLPPGGQPQSGVW